MKHFSILLTVSTPLIYGLLTDPMKIKMLGENPDNLSLDIKPLEGQPHYRLRIGQWRIIFDRDDQVKIIAIEKIKPRGGAYK